MRAHVIRGLAGLTVAGLLSIGAAGRAGASPPPATVVVRSGQTLSGVAAQTGVSIQALAAANGIADVNRVFAGQVLHVPGRGGAAPAGDAYIVRKGDTLGSIAAARHLTIAALAAANGIGNPNHIVIGTHLTIPGASAPSAATAPPAASPASSAPTGLPTKLLASPSRLALRSRFEHWAAVYGVPADLLEALAWMESGWQNNVVSSTGAIGIGQLMPATVDVASRLIGTRLDPNDPDANIRMSARFLRYLLDSAGTPSRALAAYYQGLAAVQRAGIYPATQHYVDAIFSLRQHFS